MVGEFAGNFLLKDQYGNEFELYRNVDRRVLLVFYPKDNTPVCTKQLNHYNNNLEEFEKNKIKVVGINTDTRDSHISFCNQFKLNFPLLIDENKEVSKDYKALNLFGSNKRKLVLINTDKKIIFEQTVLPFRYLNVKQIFRRVK